MVNLCHYITGLNIIPYKTSCVSQAINHFLALMFCSLFLMNAKGNVEVAFNSADVTNNTGVLSAV